MKKNDVNEDLLAEIGKREDMKALSDACDKVLIRLLTEYGSRGIVEVVGAFTAYTAGSVYAMAAMNPKTTDGIATMLDAVVKAACAASMDGLVQEIASRERRKH